NHAQIPGALSLPLFTDEERKIVGTTYKQQSREQAIKIGLDMFGPKMRKMVEEVEEISNKQGATGKEANSQLPTANSIFLYCWRGGMRSSAVAWLLDLYGFKVYTLAGGYKAFRNHVLQTFQEPFSFRIIGGFTGSGKTEILQELEKNGEPAIDLEKIASHKGSAFGAFKMPTQPTPEMFENLLAKALWRITENSKFKVQSQNSTNLPADSFTIHDSRPTIWLEDESQRIGDLNIPSALWETMRQSPLIFLEIPFEERLNHLTEEYMGCDTEKLMDSVRRISKRLGGLETKNTIELLEKGDHKEAFRILLNYYDKRYLKGLHNREQLLTLLTKLKCDTVTPANAQLLTKHQPA
ncbi:MAG: tRNA 2-selenouridine(34) synthase MnmH, partial [Flavisolibacter sp.]